MHPMTARFLNSKAGRWGVNKIIGAANTVERGKIAANNLAWKLRLNPQETVKKGVIEGAAKGVENADTILMNTAGSAGQYAVLSTISPGVAAASLAPGVPGVGTFYIAGKAKGVIPTMGFLKKGGEGIRNSAIVDRAMDSVVGKQPAVTFRNAGPNATLGGKVLYNVESGVADLSNLVQSAGKAAVKTIKKYSNND